MEFFDSLAQVTANRKNLKNWEQEQKNIDLRRKELSKRKPATPEELERAKSLGRAIVDAVDITDDYSETSAQKMEMATEGAIALLTLPLGIIPMIIAFKDLLNTQRVLKWSAGGAIATLVATIPLTFWATQKQKEASRIARFMARDEELKDPKSFVEYTPEQIKQAQEIAKDIPDEKEEKKDGILKFVPFRETFKLLSELSKNKKAYKKWAENRPQEEAQELAEKKANTSGATLAIAAKDKDVVTNIIKKINMAAEEYSENTETAVGTVGMLSAFAGLAAGSIAAGAAYLLKKVKIVPNVKYLEAMVGGVALLIPLFTPLFANKYIIKAAQIGRFKAKQELMEDPNNFVHRDEQEMESVKDIEAPKEKEGIFKTTIDNIKFFFKLLKDGKEYDEYKEKQEKEDNKLRKALLKVEVTDEQLTRAKNLQEKVFNVFEKADEMWQRYSEDAESATKISEQAINTGFSLIPSVLFGTWIFCTETKMGKKLAERAIAFYNKDSTKTRLTQIKQGFKSIANSKPVQWFGEGFSKIPVIGKHPGWTALGAGLTALTGGIIGGTMAIQANFTKFQKDAGKIGFMKAMEELKDPVYFVDKYPASGSPGPAEISKSQPGVISNNMNDAIQKFVEQRKSGPQTSVQPQIPEVRAATGNSFMDKLVTKRKNKNKQAAQQAV